MKSQDLLQGAQSQTHGLGWFWIVASAFFLGIMTLWFEHASLLGCFVPAAYLAIVYSAAAAFHKWHDPFNPLCLVLGVASLRFFLPGILVLSGARDEDEGGGLFQLMKLTDHDWQWGHALALLGMLAVIFGWLVVHARWIAQRPLRVHLDEGIKYASVAGMGVGFAALFAFFVMNAPLTAILSGAFRSVTIQEGTGKYFLVAYLLIAGSVLLCCYLLNKGFRWLALLPAGFAMISFWPLGGRGRAVMSVAGGAILLWYRFRERHGWRPLSIKRLYLLALPVIVLSLVTVFYVGDYYRAKDDGRADSEGLSLAGLWDYSKSAIYTDIGQLHSLAGAMAIGPAVLGGHSFIGSLTWPLSKILPLPSRNAGVFLVDTLVGFIEDRVWALNSSLIGDAYLNFGLTGVVIVMALYGALLKILYLRFRQGVLHVVIYVLAMLYGLNMLWVSIEVWPQALTVLSFALALIWAGKTVFDPRGVKAPGESREPRVKVTKEDWVISR
jgi:oligosaccharide repeat unit polymerase